MPRISDIAILSLPEQPILRVIQTAGVEQLPQVIGGGFAKLGAYLAELGGQVSDIPFVSFRLLEPFSLEVGVCFPLPAALPGRGDIEAAVLPAGPVACCMYLGPYAGTGAVHEEMQAWIVKEGFSKPDLSWECYYNGQNYPEEQQLTRITMPLAE